MTQTVESDTTTPEGAGNEPPARVDAWLSAFERALTARDIEAATELFAPTCYWRDLVAFSWNITTVEDRDGVADLLEHTLEQTEPSHFRTEETPTEEGGVVTAWILFETAVARGRGLLRLTDEGAVTLLTTAYEL